MDEASRIRQLADAIVSIPGRESKDDIEQKHRKADQALITAICILVEARPDEVKFEAGRLVQLHQGLFKWYA